MVNIEMFSQEAATKALVREERQKGIKILIETLLEVGMLPRGVSRKVVSKYDLPEEAKGEIEQIAQEMLNQKVTEALIREERKEAKEEVRQEDIRIFVKICRKMNCSDEDILESIMEDYDLSEEKAREYLAESKSGSNLDAAEDEFDKQLKDLKDVFNN